MKRALITTGTSLALALAAVVAPAGPASAACLTSKASRVTGGYTVTISCGISITSGYGSTPADANLEALLLIKLYQDGGPKCTGLGVDKDGSVYWVTLSCGVGGIGFVDGQGATLTQAAQVARLTAEVIGSGRQAES